MAGCGRIDARTFAFLGDVGGLGIEAFDREDDAAGAAMGLRAFIGEAGLDQRVGDQCAQIIRRLLLHAGGDFFREKFEQKFRHQGTPGRPGD